MAAITLKKMKQIILHKRVNKYLSNFPFWEFFFFYAQSDTWGWTSGSAHKAERVHWDSHLSLASTKAKLQWAAQWCTQRRQGLSKRAKKGRGGKGVRWQKTRRRHYELAMSDELFRDTNRPAATWFIDCSQKKVPIRALFPLFTVCHPEKKTESDFGQTPVDLRPVGFRGVLSREKRLLLET